MERIALLHSRLQSTIVLVLLVLALWGLFNYLRKRPLANSFPAVLIIGQLLIVAQALLGVLLLFAGGNAARLALHITYGVIAVLSLPITYMYVRGRQGRWENLIYALVCIVLIGVVIRAWETAQ